MKAAVVLERVSDADGAEASVEHAPSLDAREPARGVDHAHRPRQTAGRVGDAQRQERKARHERPADADGGHRRQLGRGPDRLAGREQQRAAAGADERERGERERQHDAPPSAPTTCAARFGRGRRRATGRVLVGGQAPLGRPRQVVFELWQDAHRSPASRDRSSRSPRLTRWRTTASEQRSSPAISA